MELYKRIIELVDANLTHCMVPIILALILVELIFKKRFETKKALNLIRWTIIVYAIITWTMTLIGTALYPVDLAFVSRATGPYKIAYWIMFLSALILPFSLLIEKLGTKFWYVLFVAFCMKIGGYFERIVIITTSFHKDYLAKTGNTEFTDSISSGIAMLFLQGILIAILTLGIFEITKRKKTVHNSLYEK
jgi:hypothetical protein